MIELKMWKN